VKDVLKLHKGFQILQIVKQTDHINSIQSNNEVRAKVLVVEDEEAIRQLMLRIVEDEKYLVRGAAGGQEGLKALFSWQPDSEGAGGDDGKSGGMAKALGQGLGAWII
jgi:PleD family two-component response regulator